MHKYFEIDFQESTAKKAVVIKKNKAFTDVIADPDLRLGIYIVWVIVLFVLSFTDLSSGIASFDRTRRDGTLRKGLLPAVRRSARVYRSDCSKITGTRV